MPQMGYVTSLNLHVLIWPHPLLDYIIYCLWNWVVFTEGQLLYRQAMAFVLACRRDLVVT